MVRGTSFRKAAETNQSHPMPGMRMKERTMRISKSVFGASCVLMSLCLAAAAMAQKPAAAPETKQPAGAPQTQPATTAPKGQAVISTVTVTAKVVTVNQKTREVTLKDAQGKEYSFVADPAIKNLPQMKAGDVVTATYTEALAYVVKKTGTLSASSTTSLTTAPEGQKPAAVAGNTITATVVITAIDPKVPSVTFKGPKGNTRTIKVEDPTKLEGVKVGDKVDITYTEALAVKVEAAPKKK
jgi:Cu/Ag efflux protein CusF